MSEEFLCVRCSRHMKTCCQTADIYTTLGDVRRIEQFTGQTGFTEFRGVSNPAYADQDDDPVWRDNVFRPDGTRRVVKKQANGDCMFLGNAGCVLPLETRPLICRIYPFDYTADGIAEELSEGCPTELLQLGESLIDALAMNLTDAERWHRQLYDELPREQQESLQ